MVRQIRWRLVPIPLFALVLLLPMGASAAQNGWLVPYLAVGGQDQGWHFVTVLIVQNSGEQPNSGAVEVFGDDVQPLSVTLNDDTEQRIGFGWDLLPGQSAQYAVSHQSDDLETGWMRVTASQGKDVDLSVVVLFYNGDQLAAKTSLEMLSNDDSQPSYDIAAWTREARRPSPAIGPLQPRLLNSHPDDWSVAL